MHQVLDMNNLSIPTLHSFYCTRFLNLCNNPHKRLYKIEGNVETTQNLCHSNTLNNRKRKASNTSVVE
uniref:Ovule protein n=1 Tax=Ditylenchus dipsaci TaxID=166011 RepID=A0A915E359_9BILA